MATAKDCFAENLRLIGSPVPATYREWNLNNGLRMLAEQLDQVQATQRRQEQELQTLIRQIRGQR